MFISDIGRLVANCFQSWCCLTPGRMIDPQTSSLITLIILKLISDLKKKKKGTADGIKKTQDKTRPNLLQLTRRLNIPGRVHRACADQLADAFR